MEGAPLHAAITAQRMFRVTDLANVMKDEPVQEVLIRSPYSAQEWPTQLNVATSNNLGGAFVDVPLPLVASVQAAYVQQVVSPMLFLSPNVFAAQSQTNEAVGWSKVITTYADVSRAYQKVPLSELYSVIQRIAVLSTNACSSKSFHTVNGYPLTCTYQSGTLVFDITNELEEFLIRLWKRSFRLVMSD